MIPDKIYISHHYKQPIDYGFFKTENAEPYTIPYIRKDALIEWAEDFKAKTGWYEIEVAMDDLIDKLNSM